MSELTSSASEPRFRTTAFIKGRYGAKNDPHIDPYIPRLNTGTRFLRYPFLFRSLSVYLSQLILSPFVVPQSYEVVTMASLFTGDGCGQDCNCRSSDVDLELSSAGCNKSQPAL